MDNIFNEENSVQSNIVPIEQILQSEEQQVAQPVKTKKKDKILIIQVILLVVWGVLTAVTYFFGYDLFEPFINV